MRRCRAPNVRGDKSMPCLSDVFVGAIHKQLTNNDDETLWQAALDEVFADVQYLCEHSRTKAPIFTRIGSCSHWLSPHNKGSWLSDARYAWPSGYGGSKWSIFGLPEFDWSLIWKWRSSDRLWVPVERIQEKRPLTFRLAVPARTARHSRAVVHALWTPGSPTLPNEELLQAYGFLKADDRWSCTSTFGNRDPYEVVAT